MFVQKQENISAERGFIGENLSGRIFETYIKVYHQVRKKVLPRCDFIWHSLVSSIINFSSLSYIKVLETFGLVGNSRQNQHLWW